MGHFQIEALFKLL